MVKKVSKGTEIETIARDELRVDRPQMVEHHPRIGNITITVTLIISSIIISTVILTSITIDINTKP